MTNIIAQYTLTIKADSRPGLLHLVTGIIEKKLIRIVDFKLGPPSADGLVFMRTKVISNAVELKKVALRLENVIEVYSVSLSIDIGDSNASETPENRKMNAEMEVEIDSPAR